MSDDHPTVDVWSLGIQEVKARIPIRMYSIPNFKESDFGEETIDVATLDEQRGTGFFICNTEDSNEFQSGRDSTTPYKTQAVLAAKCRPDPTPDCLCGPSLQNCRTYPQNSPVVTDLPDQYGEALSRSLPQRSVNNGPNTAPPAPRATSSSKKHEFKPPPSSIIVNGCELLVCRKVGSGGYSECYQVRSRAGRDYAAKFVARKQLKGGRTTADIVKQEFRIHRRARHPNIVRIWDLIDCEEHLALILEFCPLGTLQELIKSQGAMTEPTALQNFAQILSAVDYLHERHIHHADLKLSNILLNSLMQPVIADFGFAREIPSEKYVRRHPCGTPWYMAPEIVKTPCIFSLPSDIWALGIILFHLLYGKPVFNSKENHVVYDRIKKYDVRFPTHGTPVTPTLVLFIRAMLTPRPEMRPTSRDLVDTLAADSFGYFSGDVSRYLPILHPLPSEKRLIPSVLSWKSHHNSAPQKLMHYMTRREQNAPTQSSKSSQTHRFRGFSLHKTPADRSANPVSGSEGGKSRRRSLRKSWNDFWSQRFLRSAKRKKSIPVET